MNIYDVTIKKEIKTVFEREINGEIITTSIPKDEAPKWEESLKKMDDATFYKVSTGSNLVDKEIKIPETIDNILDELDDLLSINEKDEIKEDIFEAEIKFNNRDDANKFVTQWSRYNRLSITMISVENLVTITNVTNNGKNWIDNYLKNIGENDE